MSDSGISVDTDRTGSNPQQPFHNLTVLSKLGSINTNSHEEITTLREESSQTNVILQYKLLAAILSAVCIVIQ